MKMVKWFGFAALTLLVALGSGCASLRASGARHRYVEQQTEAHVYDKPMSTVWPQARQILFEKGFSVKDTDASTAETEWLQKDQHRQRYLLSGTPVDDASCRIEFMRHEQSLRNGNWEDDGTDRDLGLEWKLIEKASPDAAKKIEADADAAGEKARAE
jgi:hypothetical protein